jgi:hypothetical protein
MARGPAYPYVDLEQAVDFARKMYLYTKRSPADANAVIREAWSYSPTSSSSGKLVAAMKYFGLVEESAGNDGRAIRLSDRAYRILVDDPISPERRQALQDAALSPKAYLLCWTRWGAEMPPSMRSNLIFGEGFIESTVDGFLDDYKKSIAFAGLLDQKAPTDQAEMAPKEASTPQPMPQTHNGAAQPPSTPLTSTISVTDYRTDVFSLTEGTVSISWPKNLSEESFQDLAAWLDLVKRKIERAIVRNKTEE